MIGPDGSASASMRESLAGLVAMGPRVEVGEVEALVVGDLALLAGQWRMRFGAAGAAGLASAGGQRADQGGGDRRRRGELLRRR